MKIGSLSGLVFLFVTVSILAADWPMRGRNSSRNAVVPDAVGPVRWKLSNDPNKDQNILWSAELGWHSHGDPVVSNGLVWVGTNNSRPRDLANVRDAGVLMCFDERDGKFLYQYVSPRLPEGREVDWGGSSQTASPLIEGNRLWFCNTRCEVICLDIAPLIARAGEPKELWKVDLRKMFGVAPRAVMIGSNTAQCSIAGFGDRIYVNTTNASGYHRVPSPKAPSLICFEKETGRAVWQDNSPGENLLDVQHGSPLVVEIQGKPQVIMGQGDGWMRGFDAQTGEVLWKFDINSKAAGRVRLRYPSEWNDLVAMPVFDNGRIYFATGRHYEMSGPKGRLCCVDPTKRGDISSELLETDGRILPNPNSGQIWDYRGTGEEDSERMKGSLSSPAIHRGLVIVPDLDGLLHCVDAVTGKSLWIHDLLDFTLSSPLVVGDRVYMATQSHFFAFTLSRDKPSIDTHDLSNRGFESSPIFANGTLYVMSQRQLHAIRE